MSRASRLSRQLVSCLSQVPGSRFLPLCVAGADLGSGVMAGLKRGISLKILQILVSLGDLSPVGQLRNLRREARV